MKSDKKKSSNCESCFNYSYEDEAGCYTCQVSLDEDEMGKFLTDTFQNCPYYQFADEYKIVKKQM